MDRFHRGLDVRSVYKTARGLYIVISHGSVINFTGSAIVNAANQGCLRGLL